MVCKLMGILRIGYRCLALLLVLFLLHTAAPLFADDQINAYTSLGVRAGNDTIEEYVDLIAPLWAPTNSLLFINPRLSLRDEGENEFNLGLGFRRLIAESEVIIGVNTFFDSRNSKYGNRFSQIGVGTELLSKWVDARANYYLPENKKAKTKSFRTAESKTTVATATVHTLDNIHPRQHEILGDETLTTTTRTDTITTHRLFEQFEAGLEGWDAEVGAKLPLPGACDSWIEARVFGGYYDFEGVFGKSINGLKSRIELRSGPFLTFDAELFENNKLNGTDYFVGFRLQIPFAGINPLAQIKNLFTPIKRTQRQRMASEMVMRDVRIQTERSAFLENIRAKSVETHTSVTTKMDTQRNIVLANKITFVDGESSSANENGTAEDPYLTIQAGVIGAGINNTIFVNGMQTAYQGLVTLQNHQALTSSLKLNHGAGTYNAKLIPTIDADTGIAVRLADGNRVERFRLTANTGIFGSNIHDAFISDVTIFDTISRGISLRSVSGDVTINDSKIESRNIDGVFIESDATQALNLTFTGNLIDAGTDALDLRLTNNTAQRAVILNNQLTSHGNGEGLDIRLLHQAQLALDLQNNSIDADDDGIVIFMQQESILSANINANKIVANDVAIDIFQSGINTTAEIQISNNLLKADRLGLRVNTRGNNNLSAQVVDNTITAAQEAILVNNSSMWPGSTICFDIQGNTLGSGIIFSDISLRNFSASPSLRVVDFALLSANNHNASVTTLGPINTCTDCP